MTINELQEEIIEEFSLYEDWMEKYDYIIQLGKDLPLIEDQYKVDQNLIKGCQSRVWLHANYKDGLIHFTADSDAIITKGLVSLLVSVLTNHTPTEIATTDIYFIEKIGLQSHLSPTRSNGLLAMLKQMKLYAVALMQHEKNNA